VDLVALVKEPDHVCCRYRLEAFRVSLENAGHSLALCALPPRWWGRLGVYPRLRGKDVILQRHLLARWEVALLRRQARRLIYDFDDAVFLRDSYAAKGPHDTRRLRRFAATVASCDAVVAGNDFLAAQAAAHCPPARVRVIPTCVDPAKYPPRPAKPASDGKELVWIGSSSTLKGLEQVAPLLESLGRDVPGLRLRIICDRFPTFQHLPVVPRPWNGVTEADDLAAGDIGISWIPDDLWSRGKCGLKVLQYMAAGLPVIANPVGVHPEMIRHGETGYLASTPEEWRDAITRLAADPALRRTMGAAARLRAEERYFVPAGGRAWNALLAELA
jgi:glycosyltransferase involved in cell wall biosynthesis